MITRVATFLLILFLAACGGGKKVHFAQEGTTFIEKPSVTNSRFLKEVWSRNIGEGFDAEDNVLTPAITDTTVFSASVDGDITSIDLETGNVLWKTELDKDISAGVGLGDDLVFVASRTGELLALSQEDGSLRWSAPLENEVLAQPEAASGVVIVRIGDSVLAGLDSTDGEVLWRQERSISALSVRGVSKPLINGRGAVAGLADGRLLALDVDNGDTLWETAIGRPRGNNEIRRLTDIDANPVLLGTVLYVAAYQSRVVAMAMGSPRVIWSKDYSTLKTPGVDGDNIYITEQSGSVIALNRYDGEFIWEQDDLLGRGLSTAVSVGDRVVVGDFEGNLYSIDRETGKLLARQKLSGGAILQSPMKVDSSILILSENGRLTRYNFVQ